MMLVQLPLFAPSVIIKRLNKGIRRERDKALPAGTLREPKLKRLGFNHYFKIGGLEMRKLDVRWATLITFVILLSGWWYWYEYRPSQIRQDCAKYTARVSAAVANDPSIRVSGDAHLKIIRQMQEGCIDAGGAAEFEKALKEGQSVAEAN